MSTLTLRSDYEAAFELKKKGNDAFKQKDYKNALKYYSQIIIHLGMNSTMYLQQVTTNNGGANPYNESSRTSIQKQIDKLRIVAFNNMAAVYLKMEQYHNVIEYTSRVLDEEERNTKALFRRGMAYRKSGQYNEARDDLQIAANINILEQSDPAISRELSLLRKDMEKIKPTPLK